MAEQHRKLDRTFKDDIWDLRWIREPQQDRSVKTKEKLLDASVALLEQEGVDGLTIAKIAQVAGCSVGTFYHHFQDKQTVVYAVLDRLARETVLTAEYGLEPSRWHGVSLFEVLEGYVRFSLKTSKRYAGLSQARRRLVLEDNNIATRWAANRNHIRELITKLLRLRIDEVQHPNPQLALAVVLEMLASMLERRDIATRSNNVAKGPRQSEESFIREVMRMAHNYLT